MARCSICNGDGGMIAVHQACLRDLLEAVDPDILLCNLCGNTETCICAQGTPCRDLFRLDPAKAQALIEEARA